MGQIGILMQRFNMGTASFIVTRPSDKLRSLRVRPDIAGSSPVDLFGFQSELQALRHFPEGNRGDARMVEEGR